MNKMEMMEENSTRSAGVEELSSKLLTTAQSVVYPWQCDHMGHMNVMWYRGKFDEATWHLMGQIGITPSYLRNSKRAVAASNRKRLTNGSCSLET